MCVSVFLQFVTAVNFHDTWNKNPQIFFSFCKNANTELKQSWGLRHWHDTDWNRSRPSVIFLLFYLQKQRSMLGIKLARPRLTLSLEEKKNDFLSSSFLPLHLHSTVTHPFLPVPQHSQTFAHWFWCILHTFSSTNNHPYYPFISIYVMQGNKGRRKSAFSCVCNTPIQTEHSNCVHVGEVGGPREVAA